MRKAQLRVQESKQFGASKKLTLLFITAMIKFLLQPNPEMVVEASRVLANLSRDPDVRLLMVQKRGTEMLTILLDHTDRDVVLQVCGCLMNLGSGTSLINDQCAVIFENGGLD